METNSCLIVFEATMNSRYEDMARIHGMVAKKVDLNNNLSPKFFPNLIKRIGTKKLLRIKIKEVSAFIRDNNFQEIYLSNAEGYGSKNLLHHLKKEFPTVSFRALQHGIFPLRYSWTKEIIRNAVNRILYLLTGVFVFGAGFGGIKLDRYYVYSSREKDFLVKKKGWKPLSVVADIAFIKAELYESFINNEFKQDEGTVLLLLQGLNRVGLCSLEEEKLLIQCTINYLSNNYKKVIIKEHPSCGNRLQHLLIPKNTTVVDTMLEGFCKSRVAYSFFSTSLIDAKIFDIKTVGISSKYLRVDPELYKNFDVKVQFEDIICPKD